MGVPEVLCKICDRHVPRTRSKACIDCECYVCKECSKTHECFLKSGDTAVTCCRCAKVFDATQSDDIKCVQCSDYVCRPCSEMQDIAECSRSVDMVNKPPHYRSHPSGIECITIVRHMSFNTGNAMKYLWCNGLKGGSVDKQVEDLKKAVFYIEDEIKRVSEGAT